MVIKDTAISQMFKEIYPKFKDDTTVSSLGLEVISRGRVVCKRSAIHSISIGGSLTHVINLGYEHVSTYKNNA